jgi:chemotaxis protein methyltransferase CheR
MNPVMHENEYKILKTLIEEEFGLSLRTHNRDTLSEKIQPRLSKLRLKSYGDYIDYLMHDPMAKIELHNLPLHLMNTESYFLREFAQLEVFMGLFKKKMQERDFGANRPFTILSAGCSVGEEPYSISMMLKKNPETLNGSDVRIIGLDVNVRALVRAKRGIYSRDAFRGRHSRKIEGFFRKTTLKCCEKPGECLRLKTDIVKSVSFQHGNIVQPSTLKDLRNLDFIFCRNVLMYMTSKAIDRIAMNLWEALSDDGYLFVGQSESLRKQHSLFTPISISDVTVYRKNRVPSA